MPLCLSLPFWRIVLFSLVPFTFYCLCCVCPLPDTFPITVNLFSVKVNSGEENVQDFDHLKLRNSSHLSVGLCCSRANSSPWPWRSGLDLVANSLKSYCCGFFFKSLLTSCSVFIIFIWWFLQNFLVYTVGFCGQAGCYAPICSWFLWMNYWFGLSLWFPL